MFRTSSVHHQERFVQAVCADLVCGTTVRTTRHVQLHVSSSTHNSTTYQICEYSLYKTLLTMGRWGPKHVELTWVLIKTYSLRQHCVSCWTTYIVQDDTRTLQYQVTSYFFSPRTKRSIWPRARTSVVLNQTHDQNNCNWNGSHNGSQNLRFKVN